MNDLRIPIGSFFTITGAVLVGMGVFFPAARAPMTEANVNLFSGLAMLAFGGIMLLLARRAS